jgi:hypothetical protein
MRGGINRGSSPGAREDGRVAGAPLGTPRTAVRNARSRRSARA